jgi:ribosomal protein S18 acetylase RimI-like enzyme
VDASAQISLRSSSAGDSELFYRVVFETMRDHVIETWGSWNDARVRAESIEVTSSPGACVVLVNGKSAGVMTVRRLEDHLQLEQLYLLPEFQGRGVGTFLMRGLIADSKASGLPARLRVLRVNPARHFYEKLGFIVTLQTTERVYMECPL